MSFFRVQVLNKVERIQCFSSTIQIQACSLLVVKAEKLLDLLRVYDVSGSNNSLGNKTTDSEIDFVAGDA